MQQKIIPLEKKLAIDGLQPYTIQSAMQRLGEKIKALNLSDLADDLLPLFEQGIFIEAWLEGFKENFWAYMKNYEF